jgi:protein SCO1/2
MKAIALLFALPLLLAAQRPEIVRPTVRNGIVRTWWPNGTLQSEIEFQNDVYHGVARRWYETGRPYELRHFDRGHEAGVQQSWTEGGEMYLNYEVRNGRRYGFVNSKPCAPVTMAEAAGGSGLPFYTGADFTPQWTPSAPRDLPVLDLLTQRNTAFHDADLAGRIHVASFLFTRCNGVCPVLVERLKRLQSEAPADVALVSFTVTPDRDRPQDLAAFGSAKGIDPARWHLLTGSARQIFDLARNFYFADDRRLGDEDNTFLHTEKVLLVDRHGRLRGVYNGTLPFEIEKLVADVRRLKQSTE